MKLRVIVKIGHRHGLLGWDGNYLHIGIDAPPLKGAANKRLIELVSDWLHVSKNMIQIAKGHNTRYKTLEVNIDPQLLDTAIHGVLQLPKQETLF